MTTDLVWHYTTTEGLIGIIGSNQLWASNVAFLNDPTEDLFALEALRDALQKSSPAIRRAYTHTLEHEQLRATEMEPYPNLYALSASAAGDSLDLWRSYGAQGVSGTYAIGLDPTVQLAPWSSTNAAAEAPAGWRAVTYRTKQESVAIALEGWKDQFAEREILRRSSIENDDVRMHEVDAPERVLTDLLAMIKHSSYASERERRIQVSPGADCVKIRAGAYGPTPYVPLVSPDKPGRPGSLPIRKVLTWPGSPPRAIQGVAAVLSHGNYLHDQSAMDRTLAGPYAPDPPPLVKIQRSTIPFVP